VTGITDRIGADAFVRPATLSEAKGSVLRHADYPAVSELSGAVIARFARNPGRGVRGLHNSISEI
jgi:hypothetical protein